MVSMSNAYTAASLMIQSRNNCIFGRFAVSSGHTKKCAFSDGMTRSKGEMVLNLMNELLSVRPFFVGDDYTLADIALYAYTYVAHEGRYELSNRSALKAWLDRVANQPGYVTMDAD
ncbi:MAG: glutathione binding-like protein [Pseudomonadota bacterium]|nr:glutathione binding-like protein [Pseudomonadota bacterium]